jgi:uncharacterized protein (TIGR00375 family)
MQVGDFHIHSKYARACSKYISLEGIDSFCRIKGVDIIATGDFTHPVWFKELEQKLEEHAQGLYKLKNSDGRINFIMATELSMIYKRHGKTRRVHICVMAPSIEAVRRLNTVLEAGGYNLRADGRPILGLDCEEFVKMCLDIDPRMFIFPAHIWTPWFAVFGSKSGFDSMEECFGEMTPYIHAYESGLSSDPDMNWRVSSLDSMTLISNSDAHSLQNIAREANVFDLKEISYDSICHAIKHPDKGEFKQTIEFYPEEGMYHIDGHRACNISMEPRETMSIKGICPECKRPLTLGVMHRVDELADREHGYIPENHMPFMKLVGLAKIIAESFSIKSPQSKRVQAEYSRLIHEVGSELDILMNIKLTDIRNCTTGRIVEGIRRMREGELIIQPGFDGQYGVVQIFSELEKKEAKQKKLI